MKNKTRLLHQGYCQEEGIDFDETFTQVMRLESNDVIMMMLTYY